MLLGSTPLETPQIGRESGLPLQLRSLHLQAGRVTLQALVIAALLGTGVCGALLLGADSALVLMGADAGNGQLHSLAKEYLLIRCMPLDSPAPS